MSWRNIKLIFWREVSDQLRDRRTLFMVAVLPILLYPSLGIGMLQMTLLFQEQERTVVVLGNENLPEPHLITGHRFDDSWFENKSDARKLFVISEYETPKVGYNEEQPPPGVEREKLLKEAQRIRVKLERIKQKENELDTLTVSEPKDQDQIEVVAGEIADAERELKQLIANSQIQVLIVFPKNFGSRLKQENQLLAKRDVSETDSKESQRPIIWGNSADEKSMIAYGRVREAFRTWELAILEQRLEQAGLPSNLPKPVNPDYRDVAENDQIVANVWSKLFPALLVIMAVTGAFYPAIDLGAGEKERGTMETLLICPASRTEIVIGKFFTVLLFSMGTALLNLFSMGYTSQHMLSSGTGRFAQMGDFTLPGFEQIMWVILLAIPLAALFSALSLAIAIFARSSKEGQYYLTPLLLVTMGLTIFCLSPAVEITPFYSMAPVMGPALLLKALLHSSSATAAMLPFYAVPVLISSFGYSLLALMWAIDQFQREDVLFRETERFELRLWVGHLLRDKEPTPSFSEAVFCFVLIMLLQFMLMNQLSSALSNASEGSLATTMMQLLIVQQLVIIALPAALMGLLLTTNVRKTLRLKLPKPQFLLVAAVLPFAIHPLAVELQSSLAWFFPQLPEHATAALAAMSDDNVSIWFVLLAFAMAPAICEELAFRGFILSGFENRGKTGVAIVLSSIAFGAMHMIPQQVFNAALLGLVIGLIAVRSNSLLPCMLFHFVNNSIAVFHGRVGNSPVGQGTPLEFFLESGKAGLHYKWPTLLLAGIVAATLIHWLYRQTDKSPQRKIGNEQLAAALTPLMTTEAEQSNQQSVAEPAEVH